MREDSIVSVEAMRAIPGMDLVSDRIPGISPMSAVWGL